MMRARSSRYFNGLSAISVTGAKVWAAPLLIRRIAFAI
jgi:hypothetical protein